MDYEPDHKLPHPLAPKLVTNFTGFTALADQYKVDLYLTGHVHMYQRFYPLLGPSEHKSDARPKAIDKDGVSEDGHVYTNPYVVVALANFS